MTEGDMVRPVLELVKHDASWLIVILRHKNIFTYLLTYLRTYLLTLADRQKAERKWSITTFWNELMMYKRTVSHTDLFSFWAEAFPGRFNHGTRSVLSRALREHRHRRQLRVNQTDSLIANVGSEVRPEHGLVPVRQTGSGHVFASQSAADDRVIVVLNAAPT